ncbi:hypothetical protein V1509DRAFT_66792 [Lipomyces kononenkoae]
MKFLIVQFLWLALNVSAFRTSIRNMNKPESRKVIPSAVFSGNVVANTISTNANLDGPQLSAVNSSSYEWWYFDAVSQDLKSAITIVFYTALASGFGFIPSISNVTVVGVDFLFPNGTTSSIELTATEVVITTIDQGSSAVYKDTGAGWHGAPDLSCYKVKINAPEYGVVGTFELKSIAPAHYSCGSAEAGQRMMVAPNIGWSNAIPDAVGDVDFHVNGEKYSFQGNAYHDHNWGSQPFQNNVAQEHWGRGRLGEYSLVWSTVVAPDGTNYSTVYVAANDKIITASCDPKSFSITPIPVNGDPIKGTLTGYELKLDLGEGMTLDFNVTIIETVSNAAPVYMRWTGSIAGSVSGGKVITDGVATFEEFNLS